MSDSPQSAPKPERLVSLDLFRGLVMFLLIAEGAGVYQALLKMTNEDGLLHGFFTQFTHHPWHGLRFWDLIQPAFMFIVGVAMVYSVSKRFDKGDSWNTVFKHILVRCLILLAFGTGLHCIYGGEMVLVLRNVLSQLSFTILVTFLIIRLPWKQQLAISIGMILVADIAYRVFPVEGFNHAYTPDENFGTWVDNLLNNPMSSGHWVSVNAVSTSAHTIWGSLIGQMLKGSLPAMKKFKVLIVTGVIGLAVGYLLDWGFGTEVLSIPIIKRIATGSFVYASGGYCLLILAVFYYLIDIKGWKPSWFLIIQVVGMNSIFIYMTEQLLSGSWLRPNVNVFVNGILGGIGFNAAWVQLITALVSWGILWYLCFWLYKRKIFLRI
ncbi:MAG: DUF5009 domain-containing protein [Verrucomicrobiae bacterium]|nr:DUF5009 domain-containing protein [Verrucomicrobiae bacterium]